MPMVSSSTIVNGRSIKHLPFFMILFLLLTLPRNLSYADDTKEGFSEEIHSAISENDLSYFLMLLNVNSQNLEDVPDDLRWDIQNYISSRWSDIGNDFGSPGKIINPDQIQPNFGWMKIGILIGGNVGADLTEKAYLQIESRANKNNSSISQDEIDLIILDSIKYDRDNLLILNRLLSHGINISDEAQLQIVERGFNDPSKLRETLDMLFSYSNIDPSEEALHKALELGADEAILRLFPNRFNPSVIGSLLALHSQVTDPKLKERYVSSIMYISKQISGDIWQSKGIHTDIKFDQSLFKNLESPRSIYDEFIKSIIHCADGSDADQRQNVIRARFLLLKLLKKFEFYFGAEQSSIYLSDLLNTPIYSIIDDKKQKTYPLILATTNHCSELIGTLVKYGSNPELTDFFNKNSIQYAYETHTYRELALFLSIRSEIDASILFSLEK